jgi:hypothetical protein
MKRPHPPTHQPEIIETSAKCRVCGGVIVQQYGYVFDASMGPMIIGPGYRDQVRRVVKGVYCRDCRIAYFDVPSETNKGILARLGWATASVYRSAQYRSGTVPDVVPLAARSLGRYWVSAKVKTEIRSRPRSCIGPLSTAALSAVG